MSDACLFCKIIAGDIPAKIIKSTQNLIAFHDINPAAPHHILIIPKEHIRSINELNSHNTNFFGSMMIMTQQIAQELFVKDSGFRLVINTEAGAGQSVFHLHMHMLAGREFSWPPG